MALTTIRFNKVEVRGVRRWTENGKRRQETKVFWQTRSPFNRNAQGEPKSLEEIRAEIIAERDKWLKEAHGGTDTE